ncbi:hypothetical protein [Spirosoma montaniterrae]|uniref:Glycosyltransferase RgtA/B/C/D-like domain-containing protein n=1 Tax=Spirosoma montaniterrae TaxID=1178516 RepID=A0A1P9X1T6_9BACT|nr:hypothetical protein [Spirosoma montaniterrae]AQG81589.1 hypothetical protein AWR27_21120 [Spirosoma montaniterrae]
MPFLPVLWGLLLAIPAGWYTLTVFQNAYNFPYEDDFNSALSFVSAFVFIETSFAKRVDLLFSQYNEHRIVFDRLVFLADYYLFGVLNFRRLTLVGNLSIVLLAVLFLKTAFRRHPWPKRLFFFIPVAYSLFLFQYWELTTWSMAALQNLYVIAFAFSSLYCLVRPGQTWFILACSMAVLATFTSGNGMFCFAAGIPLLLLLKQYRKVTIWTALGAMVIILYFQQYYRPPYHPNIADSLLNHPGRAIQYFFSLIGAFFPNRPTISLLFGIASVLITAGAVAYLFYTRRLLNYLPLVGLLLFLYLTSLSLTAGRSGFGVQQAFSTRYGIITVMLFVGQVVLVIEAITHRLLQTSVTVAYGLFAMLLFVSGTNVHHRRNIEARAAQLRQTAAQYRANPNSVQLPWGDPVQAKAIFDDAIKRGIYRVEE